MNRFRKIYSHLLTENKPVEFLVKRKIFTKDGASIFCNCRRQSWFQCRRNFSNSEENSKHKSIHVQLKEKKLFTPGPLSVSPAVKAALGIDLGSRDDDFIQIVKNLRYTLLDIASLPSNEFTAILMQGSGTFAVESVLQSTSKCSSKVLIVENGAYGKRMKTICDRASIPCEIVSFPETQPVDISQVIKVLDSQPGKYSSVSVVHCETTSGVMNPIAELGQEIKIKFPNLIYIVDAMSSFAGVIANYSSADFLISSANKCLQGIPGFAFVLARITKLGKCKGLSPSLSLDLHEQWEGLENTGQFRFTPPTHAILGLAKACEELYLEGGVTGREERYRTNCKIIRDGMRERGFKQLICENAGHIITSFHYLPHVKFCFNEFYQRLGNLGQVIYPGKVTNADCFRIGHIGHLSKEDMHHLLKCIDTVLKDMNVPI